MVAKIEIMECLYKSGFYETTIPSIHKNLYKGHKKHIRNPGHFLYVKKHNFIKFLSEVTNTNYNNVSTTLNHCINREVNAVKLGKFHKRGTYLILAGWMVDKFLGNGKPNSFYDTRLYDLALLSMEKYGKIVNGYRRKLVPSRNLVMSFDRAEKTSAELQQIILNIQNKTKLEKHNKKIIKDNKRRVKTISKTVVRNLNKIKKRKEELRGVGLTEAVIKDIINKEF